jgi:hypothetical protein
MMQTLTTEKHSLKKHGIYSGVIVLAVALFAALLMALRTGALDFWLFVSPHVIGQFVLIGGILGAIGGAWLGSNTAHFENANPTVPTDAHKRGQKFIDRLGLRALTFVGLFGLFAVVAGVLDAFSRNPYFTSNIGKIIEGALGVAFFIFGATMSVTLSSLLSTFFRNRYLITFLTTLGFGVLVAGTIFSAVRLSDFLTRTYYNNTFLFIILAVLTASVINLLLTFWGLKRVRGTK